MECHQENTWFLLASSHLEKEEEEEQTQQQKDRVEQGTHANKEKNKNNNKLTVPISVLSQRRVVERVDRLGISIISTKGGKITEVSGNKRSDRMRKRTTTTEGEVEGGYSLSLIRIKNGHVIFLQDSRSICDSRRKIQGSDKRQ
jgi:hypothetical protein